MKATLVRQSASQPATSQSASQPGRKQKSGSPRTLMGDVRGPLTLQLRRKDLGTIFLCIVTALLGTETSIV